MDLSVGECQVKGAQFIILDLIFIARHPNSC